jgi:hypothetical protein
MLKIPNLKLRQYMTKVTFNRAELSAGDISRLVEKGERVRETPHLGGPHSNKYALTLGGLASDVVLVDTIKAQRDRFGRTGDIDGLRIVSNKLGEQRIAASMRRFKIDDTRKGMTGITEVKTKLKEMNLAESELVEDCTVDLVGVHKAAVEKSVAPDTNVVTFAELWRSSGDVSQAVIQAAAEQQLLHRWFSADLEKVVDIGGSENQFAFFEKVGAYFDDPETANGVLPCVEALFAIEAVNALILGREAVYDHLYVASSEYTKDQHLIERIRSITLGASALLGLSGDEVQYNFLITNNETWDQAGGSRSHFEMVKASDRFNWRRLANDEL